LKNLPPNAISRIEILRTPSAKYDASGTGGVVNIILRKGVKPGVTGSATAGVQQGKYGNQFVSFNLNNNDGKKSSFVNLNYSRRNSFETIRTDRLFAADSMLSQLAFTLYPGQSAFAGYGVSDEWKKNWDVNVDAGLSYNSFNNRTENQSSIHLPVAGDTLTSSLNRVSNKGFSLNTRTGINFIKKLDTTGSQWENDIFYSYNQNRSNQGYTTAYSIPFNYFSSGDGDGDNARHLFDVKSDLKVKAANRLVFETGVKYSLVSFESNSSYFTGAGSSRKPDNTRTSAFHFTENVNAFYAQGSKTFWKNLVLKAGGRVENTNMDGRQSVPGDTSFVIHRTDFFPYVYFSKKVISIAGYELRSYLVYRRTISRPGYDQLNPFPRYVDQYLSEVGNPALRPQFTTNYEANISVDERPLLAVGYNKTRDIFTNVVYQADSTRSVSYRTFDNVGTNKEIYLRGLGAIPPGHRYFFVLGGQFNHNLYNGKYQDEPLVFEKDSWTFFTYHQLKIDRLSQFTLSGFVRFHGLQQFYELSTFGALNTSINRQFFNKKLVVTLSL
ncbi:MAG TPA: TonB-dependent receptor, partial [Chitinophagaceae bacterium]